MYLRKLHVRNLKLLRDVEIDFTGEDGNPRPFTVFVGENGLCKTSLLQAIALAASGSDRANQLAEASSYPDLRRSKVDVKIDAVFSFSERYHASRVYPALEDRHLEVAPRLWSHIGIAPGLDVFRSVSGYADEGGDPIEPTEVDTLLQGQRHPDLQRLYDPLSYARGRNLPHWFVAAYGISRTLPVPASVTPDEIASPSRDRLLSLFKATRIIGTGFADLLPPERAEAFNTELHAAFIEHGILPHAKALSLRARGNIPSAADRVKAHRLTLDWKGHAVDVPTIWLSQGYQAMMAWVADLVGQVWWEAEKQVVPLHELEGICLVDEIDLHLHPLWQVGVIRALKATFPKIQFIATTHSPMVLPGLRQDEILRLKQDEEGNVVVRPAKESPALMTGSELYRRFFGIERLEPRELDDKVVEYATLASYAGRSAEEDKKVQQLHAELVKAGIDPGFEPTAREPAPKKKRAAGTKRTAAPRKRQRS